MKLIAEGKFSDGFGAISTVQFFEGKDSNKIVEYYRGIKDEYVVKRDNDGQIGKYFMHPFYFQDTPYCCRFSEMLESIRKKF